jgi:hypothetical protein
MDQPLAAAVDEVLGHAEPVVDRLKHGGGEADLRDLRRILGRLPREIERDRTTNGAAQDLCGAAAALVADNAPAAHRSRAYREARLRLFCEMHLRFYTRLMEIARTKSAAAPRAS